MYDQLLHNKKGKITYAIYWEHHKFIDMGPSIRNNWNKPLRVVITWVNVCLYRYWYFYTKIFFKEDNSIINQLCYNNAEK